MVWTVSAAMLAADAGVLLPAAAVRDYLPEYKQRQREAPRQDLLSGLSGHAEPTR
jgi:hypothetical protein